MRPCLERGCPNLTPRTRCPAHERKREQARGTRNERGYDYPHRLAREALAATLPAPCYYCRRLVQPEERWVAAHVVDGERDSPRVVAHGDCNERAKVR